MFSFILSRDLLFFFSPLLKRFPLLAFWTCVAISLSVSGRQSDLFHSLSGAYTFFRAEWLSPRVRSDDEIERWPCFLSFGVLSLARRGFQGYFGPSEGFFFFSTFTVFLNLSLAVTLPDFLGMGEPSTYSLFFGSTGNSFHSLSGSPFPGSSARNPLQTT